MKIPSLFYIDKSLAKLRDGGSSKYSLFGHGSYQPDVVISDGTKSFIEQISPNRNGSIIELGNVIIESNVSVCGLPTNMRNVPFFLKVSGTLIVKGHLHMDGMGASTVNYNESSTNTYTNNGLLTYYKNNSLSNTNLISGFVNESTSCTDLNWSILNAYGSSDTFFTLTQGITGAGGCGIRYLGSTRYGVESRSLISGGGNISGLPIPTLGNSSTGGGGGGFLGIYCSSFVNTGGQFTDDLGTYPLSIHANGGTGIYNNNQPVYGGGMMVIAARRLIVEPGGSITCDASDGNGLMALANRSPNYTKMMFNNRNPINYTNQFSGGAGYCALFKR